LVPHHSAKIYVLGEIAFPTLVFSPISLRSLVVHIKVCLKKLRKDPFVLLIVYS